MKKALAAALLAAILLTLASCGGVSPSPDEPSLPAPEVSPSPAPSPSSHLPAPSFMPSPSPLPPPEETPPTPTPTPTPYVPVGDEQPIVWEDPVFGEYIRLCLYSYWEYPDNSPGVIVYAGDMYPYVYPSQLEQFSRLDIYLSDFAGKDAFLVATNLDLHMTYDLQHRIFIPAGETISSLADLRHFPNLHTLFLSDIGTDDISALASLPKLRTLCLENSGISDLSPLAGLVQLEMLTLNNNRVTDLSPLAGLANLNYLALSPGDYPESFFEPLKGLPNLQIEK